MSPSASLRPGDALFPFPPQALPVVSISCIYSSTNRAQHVGFPFFFFFKVEKAMKSPNIMKTRCGVCCPRAGAACAGCSMLVVTGWERLAKSPCLPHKLWSNFQLGFLIVCSSEAVAAVSV